jgi:hypothetical protein
VENSCTFFNKESNIKTVIIPSLEKIQALFKEPQLIMKKRQAKLLDFERVNEMKANGDVVDKPLLESADAFQSINDQLNEELPVFLSLVSEYVQTIMFQAIQIQGNLYQLVWMNIAPLTDSFNIDKFTSTQDIPKQYLQQMAAGCEAEIKARSIRLLDKWHESVWGIVTN